MATLVLSARSNVHAAVYWPLATKRAFVLSAVDWWTHPSFASPLSDTPCLFTPYLCPCFALRSYLIILHFFAYTRSFYCHRIAYNKTPFHNQCLLILKQNGVCGERRGQGRKELLVVGCLITIRKLLLNVERFMNVNKLPHSFLSRGHL